MNDTQTVFFKEFTDIVFPAALIARGFEDESWHKDTAPRAVRKLGTKQLTVWVDYDNPEWREIPGAKKFLVVIERDYDDAEPETVGEFDDEPTMLRVIDSLLNSRGAR